MMIKKQLEKEVTKIVNDTLGLQNIEVMLEHPTNESFGDFTTNIALKTSKQINQSPKEIASKLIESFYKSERLREMGVTKIELAGPGFINFHLSQELLTTEVGRILSQKDSYGASDLLKDKKVMIEFADPNPFKEFHIGHLRNISLGESLVRLQKALGADVWPVNYQGDVGLQTAKSLWGLKKMGYNQKKLEESSLDLKEKVAVLGQAYVAGAKAYDGSEEAKKEIVATNLAVYNQDVSKKELMDLWKAGRAWSLEYFEEIYKRLGTSYKRYYFESQVAEPGRDLVLSHMEDGIFEKSEGAIIFNGEKYGLHTRVFIAKEGYATYEAKEMYLAPLKYKDFAYDLSIILTGNEIIEYFKVLLCAISKIYPDLASKTLHLPFGMVNLKEGKMSSRKGNVVTAGELVDEAKEKVCQIMHLSNLSNLEGSEREEITEKVSVGAVKYFMLRSDKSQDIRYDINESVSLEGNSGPYLQYTYARARSVLRKSSSLSRPPDVHDLSRHPEGLTTPKDLNSRDPCLRRQASLRTAQNDVNKEELAILRTLYRFPEVVESAALKYEPHQLCGFLFDLAQKFNQFYNNVPIIPKNSSRAITGVGSVIPVKTGIQAPESLDAGSPSGMTNGTVVMTAETPNSRLAITAATAQILKNGLYLLGIETPERM